MKIVFLIPKSGIGGGNYVVNQHALWAQEAGHDVTIATLSRDSPYEHVWHPAIPFLHFKPIDELADIQFDIAIATFWSTALELHDLKAHQYVNFIQSIESRFYGSEAVQLRALIDSIYTLKLPVLTEATWIKQYLEKEYGSRCKLVRNGIRKDLYEPHGPCVSKRQAGRLRVLVEGPFGAIKNTARAMATARRAGADDIWLLTTSDIPWYPRASRIFSNVPIEQVPPIYRSCDAIVKLSLVEGMFGPPLEMFHCGGTAVVYDVSGHDEYIVNDKNALVAPMHDEARVIESIRRLREDAPLLARLKEGALEAAAAWPSWEVSSRQFMVALEQLYAMDHYPQERLRLETDGLRETYQHRSIRSQQNEEAALPIRMTAAPAVKRTLRRYKTYANHIIDGYR